MGAGTNIFTSIKHMKKHGSENLLFSDGVSGIHDI